TRGAYLSARVPLRNPPKLDASVAKAARDGHLGVLTWWSELGEPPGSPRPPPPVRCADGRFARLLDLDGRARFLELRLDRVGLVLGDAFLDRLRSRVHEVLGLLQTETGDRAHDLDHLDLLAARGLDPDVEGGLLLRRGAVTAGGGCAGRRDRDRSGGRDAPLVLDLLLQLDQLEDGHLPQLVEHLVDTGCCHLLLLLLRFSGCLCS